MSNYTSGVISANIPGKEKLMAFYSSIKSLDSVTRGIREISAAATTIQDALELVDLPLLARLMRFRLKKHDGTTAGLPELILRINPDTLNITYKKRSNLVYTTGGFVTQHWHDDVISIDASGWVPSFKGRAKILSDGYQVFLGLLDIYTKCGNVQRFLGQQLLAKRLGFEEFLKSYTDAVPKKVKDKSATEQPASEQSASAQPSTYETLVTYPKVELYYQNDMFEGIFTEFSSEENYEFPNTLRYKFRFIADKKIDTTTASLDTFTSKLGGFGKASSVLRALGSFSGPRIK